MRKNWLPLILMTVLLSCISVAMAQEEILEGEALDAAFERLQGVYDAAANYSSYYVDELVSDITNTTLTADGEDRVFSQTVERTTQMTVIRGDNPNAFGEIHVFIEDVIDNSSATTIIRAEVRFVDDMLYVNAVYEETGSEEMPSLPEGWVVVEDIDDFPEFYHLNLYRVLDMVGKTMPKATNPLWTLELIAPVFVNATQFSEEVDGTPSSWFVFNLGWAGVRYLMEKAGRFNLEDPTMELVFNENQSREDLGAFIVGIIDENDELFSTMEALRVEITDQDASVFGQPEGTTYAFSFQMNIQKNYSNINAEVEPATAPDM